MLNKKSIRKYGLTLSIAALCLVVLSGTALGVGPGYAQSSAPAVKENHPVIKDDGLISPRIVDLTKAVQSGNRAAVEEFWQQVTKTGAPIVEPIAGDDRYSFVTFLWRAKAETHNVGIFGGLAGIEMLYMSRLLDTDLWYRTFKVRNDARFTYNLSPNDSEVPINKVDLKDIKAVMKRISTFTIDPLNPHKFASAPPTSMVELPGAPPQPWIARGAGVPERKVEQKKLKSAILNNERNIWVYTPAGFNATGADYDLLVLFDGIAYTQWVPTPVILDNMIAKGLIPPTVAIVLDNPTPTSRGTELPCSAPFADFLAKEVVPFMRQNYHATSDASRTVVAGSSFGGLASTFAGLRHSEIFGNVLSQSGSYWWTPDGDTEHEWLTRQFVDSPKLPVRFYMDVGLLEAGPMPDNTPDQVAANRHLRDVLKAKGYAVTYREFNGAHEYLNWRGTLSDGLLALIGKDTSNSASAKH